MNTKAGVRHRPEEPTLDPYTAKLERFELFSTNQCYYLVGCDKLNTGYRVLKLDRTLIERPRGAGGGGGGGGDATTTHQHPAHAHAHAGQFKASFASSTQSITSGVGGTSSSDLLHPTASSDSQSALADNSHKAKPTLRPLSEFLTEDPNVYTQDEIKTMLDMIHDGNLMSQPEVVGQSTGGGEHHRHAPQLSSGLKPLVKAYGVVGFIRFLDCYYLTLITKRAKVGSIGGNGIYTIKNTETIPLKPAEQTAPGADDLADPSSVLLSMWNRGKRSVGLGLTNREIAELRYQGLYQVVDLTKNFLFSYTYDLTRSLQDNFLITTATPCPPPPGQDMYAWNFFLTREFEGCLHSLTSYNWIMPIVHGAYLQRKVNDYGRSLNIVLLARRSRHFAGTRYLKRGVSEEGKVANDVEHEQILHDESKSTASGIYSSYIQVRGSLPVYWTQESSVTMPKPPIELNRVDPSYRATQLHFEDLMKRYSSPIVVLDLVKQSEKREREVRVGNEFRHAIDYINSTIDAAHKIRYCALDYSHISKHRNLDVSASLNDVSTWAVNQTGFFCSSPRWKITEGGLIKPFTNADGLAAERLSQRLGVPVFPMEQNGVLRTNCIDCLDRTNVAQFSAGVEAIGQQLVVMGVRSKTKLDPASNIVRVLIDMFVEIGDSIALQYGGSEAHKKVTATNAESNIPGPIGKHKELLTSIRRYYSNAFTDRLKQDAMNLFLGYYVPYNHSVPLWEMETDYYLHNFHVKAGRGSSFSMQAYERSFGVDFSEDEPTRFEKTSHRPYKASASRYRLGSSQGNRGDESLRIGRVRNRCKAQNEVLSSWWKTALQENITQRMWMHLGGSDQDSTLPPRFDRLYQPDKLGQFDRFFTRSWTTPVRRSHSSQHSDGPGSFDLDGNAFTRVFSEDNTSLSNQCKGKQASRNDAPHFSGDLTLEEFIHRQGLEPPHEPSLKALLSHKNVGSVSNRTGFEFLGHCCQDSRQVPPEYQKYVEIGSGGPTYASEKVEEFSRCLREHSLKSDDVKAIQKVRYADSCADAMLSNPSNHVIESLQSLRQLAESAHINDMILSGPYQGLQKDRSAIEVATAIQEQFNAFESLQSGGPGRVESELRRRGYETEGVKEAVRKGWTEYKNAEQQYSEIVSDPIEPCRRSDLTNADSLRLYAMCNDESTTVTVADQIFLTGSTPSSMLNAASNPLPSDLLTQGSDAFVKKAARLGIPVIPRSELARSAYTPLFRFDRRRDLPPGIEQINEDMFARKDNKFMVFNGVGIDSWHGTQPVTKASPVEDILLTTLS